MYEGLKIVPEEFAEYSNRLEKRLRAQSERMVALEVENSRLRKREQEAFRLLKHAQELSIPFGQYWLNQDVLVWLKGDTGDRPPA